MHRLLVANRGEIARRVFATCRRLGIETVAVFSDTDAQLPFVGEADVAVRLPGSTPAATYLRGDLIVEAAQRAGADAVHPGYGFLSESADFAQLVLDAGLVWVGPTPESIKQMGSKVAAKQLMHDAGVPVLGNVAVDAATPADLPLLVKASAGGGGHGMRVVRELVDLLGQIALAAAEAQSAFGDATVFCEPYVEHGRHVEVQIWGNHDGTELVVLGARDCSVQRNHQKVIEESPPADIAEATLQQMFTAARTAGSAVGYVGAGTVEFLYDAASERFWFLEMNTRLQVEHPVTECVMGVDLVELQLVSADPSLFAHFSRRVGQKVTDGHAVEVRLYAEDPAVHWQPQSGTLTEFDIPGVSAEFDRLPAYGVRVDAGFEAGNEISTHYDAMLAKVICWAPTRPAALRRLANTLAKARIHGVTTNRDLLVNVLRHAAFVAGAVGTDFLADHDLAALTSAPSDAHAVRLSAMAATIALAECDRRRRTVQQRIPVGWRNVTSQPQRTQFVCAVSAAEGDANADESDEVTVAWHGDRDGYRLADDVRVITASPTHVTLADMSVGEDVRATSAAGASGVERVFEVFVRGDRIDVESSAGHVALTRVRRFTDPADEVATGSLLAPMPGTVVDVVVAAGDEVRAGQTVLVLEAMKMQHTVAAPLAGTVSEIPVAIGDQVSAGTVLAVVQPETVTEGAAE